VKHKEEEKKKHRCQEGATFRQRATTERRSERVGGWVGEERALQRDELGRGSELAVCVGTLVGLVDECCAADVRLCG
jgi:hypothetical protein